MRQLKKITTTISLSFIVLFSLSGIVNAETTISAEGQYIFNTLAFYFCCFSRINGSRFLYA